MGINDGSILATIITTHMPRNDAAAPAHVCPGIRIQAIDIVQPPVIGIPPISDMDAHQAIVSAALAAKTSAETPEKARCGIGSARAEIVMAALDSLGGLPHGSPPRSALGVLVVAAPPDARLVAPLGRAVEPWVHAPDAVHPALVGGVGVVDDAVLEHERAQARQFAQVRGRIDSR